ncbi:MAG TPA: glycosyltransferase [Bryobacteraceae bacterium]|nr:glycosyltransferase [Bryobacteraceae bacterium]
MRILFFCPQQIWPVNSGSRLRNAHLATALARRCSVTVIQILQPSDDWKEPAEASLFEDLLVIRKKQSYTPGMVLKGMLGPQPVTVLNYQSAEIGALLEKTLASRPFDAVQMETSNLVGYLDIIRRAPGRPSLIVDWHNIDSELMSRFAAETKNAGKKLVARRTATLLAHVEAQLAREAEGHAVCSERDRQALLAHNPHAKIAVVPNGVDASAFTPVPRNPENRSLLFVGSMDYHANVDAVVWFARSVWPEIARRHPQLVFTIAGRRPGPEIQALASDRIRVTGTVDDIRPYYAQACAVIVPVRVGSGTRLKILEAMAMGVPVISTTLGAEGIAVTDGQNILLADTESAMSDAVGRILSDPSFAERIAGAARNLVANEYDWQLVGEKLYDLHAGLAAGRGKLVAGT